MLLVIKLLFFVITQLSFASEEFPTYEVVGPANAIVHKGLPDSPTVIYLHGYGGIGLTAYEDMQDEINKNKLLKSYNWIFPDSPRGGWFSIMSENHQVWQQDLKNTRKYLDKIVKATKADPAKIIWAGFSMGAITAVDYVLHSKSRPLALVVDSGMYFDSKDWKRKSPHLQGLPFFMTHDTSDETLPFEEALKLESLLKDNGLSGKLNKNRRSHNVDKGFFTKVAKQLSNPQTCLAIIK